MSSPYRVGAEPDAEPDPPRPSGNADRELIVPFAVVWAYDLLRIVTAIRAAERFDAVSTLAVIGLLGLPWLLRGALLSLFRQTAPRIKNP